MAYRYVTVFPRTLLMPHTTPAAHNAMAQNATSASSLHVTTADALTYRGLDFIEIDERKYPRSLEDIRKEFRQVVETDAASSRRSLRTKSCREKLLFSDESLAELQGVMTRCHADENKFDEALFKAFGKCLHGCNAGGGKNAFVLRSRDGNNTDKYAVGFARQAKPGLELIPMTEETEERVDTTSSTSAGLEANSQADHAVCLFERVGRKWKINECFVMIELKTNESNCVEFETDEHTGGVRSVDLRRKQGALAQELLYTMQSVVLYHARSGIWEKQIPMAIIAGRKETAGEESKRRRLTKDRLGGYQPVFIVLRYVAMSLHLLSTALVTFIGTTPLRTPSLRKKLCGFF